MSKTVELFSIKIECKLNLTADHWQLYNLEGREAERDKVAVALNRSVEKRLAEGKLKDIASVLYLFREWGAADTEGYDTLAHILELCNIDADHYV